MNTLVLLSGGLDSAVLAAHEARSASIQPVYVNVGLAWETGEVTMVERLLTAKAFAGSSDAMAEQGAKVVTARDIRWERRDIKSVGLLANAGIGNGGQRFCNQRLQSEVLTKR